MKRGKKLFALLLVLVLVLGATYAVTLLNSENDQTEEEPVTTVFTLDADNVTYISWDYYEPVSFEKRDGQWSYTGDSSFPLDSSYIDTMLDALAEVITYKTIEAVEDWDQYTLEEPYCEISLTVGGIDYTLKIGEESALGGQRYFSIGDGNAYLIDSAVLDAFSYELYDLLVMESIPDMSNVTSMNVESVAESYTVAYSYGSELSYTDEYVWFMEDKVLDTQLTENLLATMTDLYWVECVEFHATDLSEYGLSSPDAVITVNYMQTAEVATNETDEDGNPIYETVQSEEAFMLEIGNETGDYRYARISGSNMVYKVPSSIAETLMYTTYYELQPDEVLLMDWDSVTGIEIILNNTTYVFTKETKTVADEEDNESEETVFTLNEKETNLDTVTGILDNMVSSGYATGLTPERAEEIRIIIHRNRADFPDVELVFYQYDSAKCMTTLNSIATVFVSRENVVSLVEEVNSIVLDSY